MSRYANIPWHTMTVQEVEQTLKTDRNHGLTRKEARRRRERRGESSLFCRPMPSVARCLSSVFADASLLLLLAVCVIGCVFALRATVICSLILLLLCCGATLAVSVRERQIRHAVDKMTEPRCVVVRGGRAYHVAADDVLPGDLIRVARGDVLLADARLLFCSDDFALVPEGDGAQSQKTLTKCAETVYDAEDDSPVTARENMLFAGSAVERGYALALVVAVGEDTYEGQLNGAAALAPAEEELPAVAKVIAQLQRYSLPVCALMLPVTVIGCLTGEQLGLYDVFLTVVALASTVSGGLYATMARRLGSCGVLRAALPTYRPAAAILKKPAATERLERLTDVVLTDTLALSDGKWNPHALLIDGEKEAPDGLLSAGAVRLLTLAYLHGKGSVTATLADDGAEDASLGQGLLRGVQRMIRQHCLDTESIDIRTAAIQPSRETAGEVCVLLRSGGGALYEKRILCDVGERLLLHCRREAVGEETRVLDASRSARLCAQIRRWMTEGAQVLVYATRAADGCTLEGMIALRQSVDACLLQQWNALAQCGVRVTLLLPTLQEHERTLLRRLGWHCEQHSQRSEHAASDDKPATPSISVGVDEAGVLSFLQRRRQEGGVCAVVAMDVKHRACADAADVTFAYDDTPFRATVAYQRSPLRLVDAVPPVAAESPRSDEVMLRRADVLLRREDAVGGILSAVKASRGLAENTRRMLQYLRYVMVLRSVTVLLGLLLGGLSVTPPLLLVNGLVVDLWVLFLLALRRSTPSVSDNACAAMPVRISSCVLTGGMLLLLSRLLFATDAGAGRCFVFLSLLALQLTQATVLCLRGNPITPAKIIKTVLLLGGVALPPLLLLCFDATAALLGAAPVTIAALGAALAMIAVDRLMVLLCGVLPSWVRALLQRLSETMGD